LKAATGSQALVRWQVSQAAVVGMWPAGLADAIEPLWQVVQLPLLTPT